MQLSKDILSQIKTAEIPGADYFELPEKIVQFGAGVLLRGLPDYYVHKANKQGKFNGRIVVIKSTGKNDTSEFDRQDCLYTQCILGIEDGKQVTNNIVNASISRVFHAAGDWQQIINCAENPDLKIVFSNTTEAGIVYEEELITREAPVSFPGKLLAFLFHRYIAFSGAEDKGMVIVPTELIIENGATLKEIVYRLANYNKLSNSFIEWLNNQNIFCNSLVDRIVPGKPATALKMMLAEKLGYDDDLLIIAEPYNLWVIETENPKVKETLSFAIDTKQIVITNDLTKYRELKLRLLNGSHTFSCGLAHLAGFSTVDEAMENNVFGNYVKQLMLLEIAHAIQNDELGMEVKEKFALDVLDRFRNPYVEHKWMNITLQYSSKMAARNVPLIHNYIKHLGKVPDHMALGFAAYMLFMKCSLDADGKYYGEANNERYIINDNYAEQYAMLWQQQDEPAAVVANALAVVDLWGCNLNDLSGFGDAVTFYLQKLKNESVSAVVEGILDRYH